MNTIMNDLSLCSYGGNFYKHLLALALFFTVFTLIQMPYIAWNFWHLQIFDTLIVSKFEREIPIFNVSSLSAYVSSSEQWMNSQKPQAAFQKLLPNLEPQKFLGVLDGTTRQTCHITWLVLQSVFNISHGKCPTMASAFFVAIDCHYHGQLIATLM